MNKTEKIAKSIKTGGIGVLPTDTIYGIVGSALNKKTVEKIYHLRKRNLKKPMIVLISSLKDLALFKIKLSPADKKILQKLWPGKVSVILPCLFKKFEYLHRGTKAIAFRLPTRSDALRVAIRDDASRIGLIPLLRQTGPLVAPSANWEGCPPAENITEAKKYFNNKVDFYISGKISKKPSTIVSLKNGKLSLIRQGAVKISSLL